MDNYVWQFLIFTGVIADIWLKVRCKQFWSKDTGIAFLRYIEFLLVNKALSINTIINCTSIT